MKFEFLEFFVFIGRLAFDALLLVDHHNETGRVFCFRKLGRVDEHDGHTKHLEHHIREEIFLAELRCFLQSNSRLEVFSALCFLDYLLVCMGHDSLEKVEEDITVVVLTLSAGEVAEVVSEHNVEVIDLPLLDHLHLEQLVFRIVARTFLNEQVIVNLRQVQQTAVKRQLRVYVEKT